MCLLEFQTTYCIWKAYLQNIHDQNYIMYDAYLQNIHDQNYITYDAKHLVKGKQVRSHDLPMDHVTT